MGFAVTIKARNGGKKRKKKEHISGIYFVTLFRKKLQCIKYR
jgi:hypothetical protein